ncbi:hypothetical protein [Pseudorhodoplanes sp.]|uniref:hypothetical protein n=1 Tax=Pseudorhodoplanes sp. TaxID=1934341 RepID=UPI003D0BB50B
MKRISGYVLFGKFKEVRTYENRDDNGRVTSVSKSYVVHVAHEDGTITRTNIYFPRDPNYREPSLKVDEEYGFPVALRPKRGGGLDLSATARRDLMPFLPPEFE